MNRAEMKALWKAHGGSQHGPITETYTIEEQAWYRFAEALQARVREECAAAVAALGEQYSDTWLAGNQEAVAAIEALS